MSDDASSADPRRDPRLPAIPDVHGHAKGEHRSYAEERPIPYTARMLFLWFYHACLRGSPRFMMVSDHINSLTFEDPAAINLVRRALKLAEAGDLYGASETAGVDLAHAAVVSEGLRHGMRFSIGAEVDVDPRSRPDAMNIVEALRPDAMIRSVHFLSIEHPEHGPDWQWPFDNPEFASLFEVVGVEKTWELYIEAVVDAIEKLPGQILGHFYVPAKFGHWPDEQTLELYEDRVLDACSRRGMAVEINTRLFYRSDDAELKRKYRETNLRFMRKAKAKEIGICISSDAHSPKDQGNGFAEVLSMLDEAEINELIFPINARLARVALRATKEHLEQRAGRALGAAQNAENEATAAVAVDATQAAENEHGNGAANQNGRIEDHAEAPSRKRPSRAKPPTAVKTAPQSEPSTDVNTAPQSESSSDVKAAPQTKTSTEVKAAPRTKAAIEAKVTIAKAAPEKVASGKKLEKPAQAKKPAARAAGSKDVGKPKKSPVKTAVAKSSAKKAPTKKAPVKKAPVKKAPVKKSVAKKAATKKAPSKKPSAKKKSGKPRR
jgi:HisJ family histidinol phosphate phosphatase